MGNLTGNGRFAFVFSYDQATKTMRANGYTPATTAANLATVTSAGGNNNGIPTGPCTVKEWKDALTNATSRALSMSPAISPSLSPNLMPFSPETMGTDENLLTFPEEEALFETESER